MKKILCGVLTLLIAVSFCACAKKQSRDNSSVKTEESSTSVSSGKDLVYDSTEAFDYSEVDGGVIITFFKNYDFVEYDKIIVPESIDGKPVIGIGELNETDTYYGKVFGSIPGHCEVVIPDTVTYIGGEAFRDAHGLVKVSGGKNCTKIGEYAFMNCINLTDVTFIDNVTDLADTAFAGCKDWEIKLALPSLDEAISAAVCYGLMILPVPMIFATKMYDATDCPGRFAGFRKWRF